MDKPEIDKIVCAWSMRFGIAMSRDALDALVDALAAGREGDVVMVPSRHTYGPGCPSCSMLYPDGRCAMVKVQLP